MTSMKTTYTSQHAWFQYCTNFKIHGYITGQNTHKIILHLMSLKHFLVSNEILIKLLFCYFSVTLYHFMHISYSLLSLLDEKCQRLFSDLSASLFSFKCKLHAYLFNLCTENSAIIACDKYYILIFDIEVTEYSHNSILSVFQTNRMRGFATFITVRRHATE